jgi:antitoxin component of MazEF toxin-antitoxin module
MVKEKKPAKVVKIGNSLGFRVPKKYFDVLGIKPGDKFDLNVEIDKAVFGFKRKKQKVTL